MPKVSSLLASQEIVLSVFREEDSPVPFSLDMKRALWVYLKKTKPFRLLNVLFIYLGTVGKGKKVSNSTLSRWIKQAIS